MLPPQAAVARAFENPSPSRLERLSMSIKNPVCAALLCASVLVMMMVPSLGFADEDFDFSVDEVKKANKKPAEGKKEDGKKKDDGDDFNFSADEGTKTPVVQTKPVIAVVVVESPAITGQQRAELQSAYIKAMQYDRIKIMFKEIKAGDAILAALKDAGGDACEKEPLCLSPVVRKADASQVLKIRVSKQDDGSLRLDVDRFDADEKLYMKYDIIKEGLKSFDDVVGAVEASTRRVFEIRERIKGPKTTDDSNAKLVKNIFAYTTAGLAVACVGGGVAFGLQARSAEDDIVSRANSAKLTQVQAQQEMRDAEDKARTANIFYGLGAAMAITSGLLFYIDLGDELAEESEYGEAPKRKLQLTPSVSQGGVGFGASLRF